MSELKIVPRSFQRKLYAAVEYVSGKSPVPVLCDRIRGGNGNHKDVEHRKQTDEGKQYKQNVKQAFVVGLIWFKRNFATSFLFFQLFFFGLYLTLFCQSHLCVLPSSNNRAFFINLGNDEVGNQNGRAATCCLEQTCGSSSADCHIALQSLVDIGVKCAGNVVQ